MHLKRQKVPKNWPVKRKGTAYVVRANFNLYQGVPVLVILRDLLGLAKNRKEAKRIIHSKDVLLNNRIIKDEKNAANLFDIISVVPTKEYYRIELSEKGVFSSKKVQEKEANQKICKIVNKTLLKGKKTQLNLSDGRNFISDINCNVNDSVLIDLKKAKIKKCVALKEKKKAAVFAGKHSGKKGVINKINLEEKMVELKIGKKTIHVLIKQMMVIE